MKHLTLFLFCVLKLRLTYCYYVSLFIVTSLAVDSVGHWVYWILREKEKSKLFRAPTVENLKDYIFNPVQEFENLNSQGTTLQYNLLISCRYQIIFFYIQDLYSM